MVVSLLEFVSVLKKDQAPNKHRKTKNKKKCVSTWFCVGCAILKQLFPIDLLIRKTGVTYSFELQENE